MDSNNNYKEKKPFFTVFIGLYNSENVIQRFFDSVNNQIFRDFELVIIDDCSSDNTVEITNKFIDSLSDVKVKFIINKKNKGIYGNQLEAVNKSDGKVFVKWDHDDYQDDRQLLDYHKDSEKYLKDDVGALWYPSKDVNGKIVGNKFPKDYLKSTYFELYSKYIFHTVKKPRERHNCILVDVQKEIHEYIYKKEILPKGAYPSHVDCWCALAMMGYKTVHINRAYRVYYMENDRPRISYQGRKFRAEGIFLDRVRWINIYMKYLPASDFVVRFRLFMSLIQYGLLSGKKLDSIVKKINNPIYKFFTIILYLPVLIILKLIKRL